MAWLIDKLNKRQATEARLAAYHEAGHVAAAILHGARLQHVMIELHRPFLGYPRGTGLTRSKRKISKWKSMYLAAVGFYAGAEAEARLDHLTRQCWLSTARRRAHKYNYSGASSDGQQAELEIYAALNEKWKRTKPGPRLEKIKRNQGSYERAAKIDAMKLVKENWGGIVGVAQALLSADKHMLDPREAYEAFTHGQRYLSDTKV